MGRNAFSHAWLRAKLCFWSLRQRRSAKENARHLHFSMPINPLILLFLSFNLYYQSTSLDLGQVFSVSNIRLLVGLPTLLQPMSPWHPQNPCLIDKTFCTHEDLLSRAGRTYSPQRLRARSPATVWSASGKHHHQKGDRPSNTATLFFQRNC